MRWLVVCVVAGCASSPPRFARSPTGWTQMQRLAGAWTGTTDGGSTVEIVVRPISRDSALAETFGSTEGRQTMTLYHADGGGLVATHYCGQGNQPRLRATAIERDRIVFEQDDVTDLDPGEPHLVAFELAFAADSFDRVEVYRRPDGTLERTTWHFTRR
jgi:hypothetical protein